MLSVFLLLKNDTHPKPSFGLFFTQLSNIVIQASPKVNVVAVATPALTTLPTSGTTCAILAPKASETLFCIKSANAECILLFNSVVLGTNSFEIIAPEDPLAKLVIVFADKLLNPYSFPILTAITASLSTNAPAEPIGFFIKPPPNAEAMTCCFITFLACSLPPNSIF